MSLYKTEVLVIGPEHKFNKIKPLLGRRSSNITSAPQNAGVSLDCRLSLKQNIKTVELWNGSLFQTQTTDQNKVFLMHHTNLTFAALAPNLF